MICDELVSVPGNIDWKQLAGKFSFLKPRDLLVMEATGRGPEALLMRLDGRQATVQTLNRQSTGHWKVESG